MDKLTRQIQKNNLWVRRRNTTADRSLQSRLRHIEHGYYRNYKQYLRDKIRTESELRDLSEKPTESRQEADISQANPAIESETRAGLYYETGLQQNSKSSLYKPSASDRTLSIDDIHITHANTARSASDLQTYGHLDAEKPTTAGRPKRRNKSKSSVGYAQELSAKDRSISSLSKISAIPSEKDVGTPEVPRIKISGQPITSTPRGPLSRSHTFAESLAKTSDASQEQVNVTCKYNIGFSPRHVCEHFPCTTPHTYHTLGFRRNDLGPWTSSKSCDFEQTANTSFQNTNDVSLFNVAKEDTHTNIDKFGSKFRTVNFSPLSDSRSKSGLQLSLDVSDTQNEEEVSFVKRNQKVKKSDFQRSFEGPAFAPKPSDPILEHVRDGGNKPLEVTTRRSARITVKDKLRGLSYLIQEMRMRNEEVKPRDWAINYGERVPMRILLNPVVPVNL